MTEERLKLVKDLDTKTGEILEFKKMMDEDKTKLKGFQSDMEKS